MIRFVAEALRGRAVHWGSAQQASLMQKGRGWQEEERQMENNQRIVRPPTKRS